MLHLSSFPHAGRYSALLPYSKWFAFNNAQVRDLASLQFNCTWQVYILFSRSWSFTFMLLLLLPSCPPHFFPSFDTLMRLCCVQRVHLNAVEGGATALVELLVAGLYFPRYATIAGECSFFMLCRFSLLQPAPSLLRHEAARHFAISSLAVWLSVWAALAGLTYLVGREVYAAGYASKGANYRMAGAAIFDIALVALLGE